jgi:hypothetical protein
MNERHDSPSDCTAVAREEFAMRIKYYTHFLLQERPPKVASEYCGVVEVSRALSRGNAKEAALVLAKNVGRESKDIKVLQWLLLH